MVLIALGLCCGLGIFAQTTVVNGRITDAKTSEPIPFATVSFKGTTIATNGLFDGTFTIKTTAKVDSLQVAFVGYKTKVKAVAYGKSQTINFQLVPDQVMLSDIVIKPGKNPAYRILEQVWEHRNENDIRQLKSYQFESYTKVEVDVDNLSERFRNRKVMKPFTYLFDSLQVAAGEDGEPVLPVFVSETLSDMYVVHNPKRRKEVVKATNIRAVGMEDGTFISQFVGSSFHDYNFYQNNITVLERTFISPISREAKGFYIHELEDSMWIGNKWCYQMAIYPKREEDLVFSGTIWIQDTTFALVRSSLEIGKSANLNFVERLKIQQELTPTASGPWVPAQTRVLMDIVEPSNQSFGMLAKLYISNQAIEANRDFPLGFFDDQLIVEEEAQTKDDAFWLENRHEALSEQETTIYNIVDTVRNFPKVKTYVDVAKTLTSGYVNINPKLEFGSFLTVYGTNVVERHRFRAGLRTTEYFSPYVKLRGHVAYGLADQRFKYGLGAEVFLSRKNWVKLGYRHKHDLEGIGAPEFYEEDPLMEAAAQLGLLERLNFVTLNRAWLQMDLHRTLTQRIAFTHEVLRPEGDFTFAWTDQNAAGNQLKVNMQVSELLYELEWTPKETRLINGNNRLNINVNKAPNFILRYHYGIDGFLNGDFSYHKLAFEMRQIARLGIWGRGEYVLKLNKTFTPLPYILLDIFPGNETVIRSLETYVLMDFFEFVSDQNMMLFYVHHFDGNLMNRVPLMRKLKWRLVASGKMAMGSLNQANRDLLPDLDLNGNSVTPIKSLDPTIPYMEVGYGFENIFRFIRIQAYHRLTYTEGMNTFGIRGSVYFNF